MDRRETEQLLRAIREAQAAGEPAALATVVRVKGSAYRREGTRMFIRRDQSYECALSGGCLEPAVADAAARVIATGEPAVISFDLADDSIWGLGIGCTGAVDIRIERLADDDVAREWFGVLERGDAAALVTPLSGATGRLLVYPDGRVIGSLDGEAVQQEGVAEARRRLAAAVPESTATPIAAAELFFEIAGAAPELVIFGAGFDAEPLSQLAWRTGFAVTVVDVREAFLSAERFPGATRVAAHFSRFAELVPLKSGTYIVVMNHHVERDRESLRFALNSDAAYIGVLGPRSRYERLVSGLGLDPQRDAGLLASVRSPAGLALGAETPQEVALSILGEMLALRRGFSGGFLSGTAGSLHRPAGIRLLARS
jgi:xanthine/CO dehydrogenase XdhC/CoxF family maturation factor